MALEIPHHPNLNIQLLCFPEIHVDLHRSFKNALSPGDRLTHEKAVSILKTIKWKSALFSFLAKPVCLIAAAGTVVILGMMLAPIIIGIIAIAALILSLSIPVIRNGISELLTESLPQLSKALADENAKANELLKQLQDQPQIEVKLEGAVN